MAKGSEKAPGSGDESVLGNLPATRPSRLGRRREGDADTKPAPARKPASKAASASAGKPAQGRKTTTKAAGAGAKKTPAARKPASPKPAAAKPKPAAAKPKPAPVAHAEPPSPDATDGRPQPVRSGSPGLSARPAEDRPHDTAPSGTELVGTVVKAAGEVAQIGFTVGTQILKRAVDRLPKP